jgi:hypothetical protein
MSCVCCGIELFSVRCPTRLFLFAVLCCAVLCCAVLCCAVLCCAVLCCAVLCCAVLCSSMLAFFFLLPQKYIPELKVEDVMPGPAGVRAQAIDDTGKLLHDFSFETVSGVVLHVRNAPSPGATSSLAIATHVVDRAVTELQLAAIVPCEKR